MVSGAALWNRAEPGEGQLLRELAFVYMHKWQQRLAALRRHRINIIGYGTQGDRLAFELGRLIADEPDFPISELNVWRPRTGPSGMDKATLDEDSFFPMFPHSQYPHLKERVHFRGFDRLDELEKIVSEQYSDTQESADLTFVLSDYKYLKSLIRVDESGTATPKNRGEIEAQLRREIDSIPELSQKERQQMLLQRYEQLVRNVVRRTLFRQPDSGNVLPDDFASCESLLYDYLAERVATMANAVRAYQAILYDEFNGFKEKRLDLLGHNAIGCLELGKVLASGQGYTGTVVNMVNDVNVTTAILLASSGLPANRLFSPRGNDLNRAAISLLGTYRDIKDGPFGGTLRPGLMFGPHADVAVWNVMETTWDDRSMQDVFGDHAREIAQRAHEKSMDWTHRYVKERKETPLDTVYSALLPTAMALITEDTETHIPALMYCEDFNGMMGLNFNVQRGAALMPLGQDLEAVASDTRQEIISTWNPFWRMTELLQQGGLMPEMKPHYSEPLALPKIKIKTPLVDRLYAFMDEQKGALTDLGIIIAQVDDLTNEVKEVRGEITTGLNRVSGQIAGIQLTQEQTKQLEQCLEKSLNADVYLPSLSDDRVLSRYRFRGSQNPTEHSYVLSLTPSVRRSEMELEHERLHLDEFVLTDTELFIRANRIHGHGAKEKNEYWMFIHDSGKGQRALAKGPITAEEPGYELGPMVSHGSEVYSLLSTKKGISIVRYDRTSNRFIHISDLEGNKCHIASYRDGLVALEDESLQVIDVSKKLAHENEPLPARCDGNVRVLKDSGLLFYSSECPEVKEPARVIVALNLDDRASNNKDIRADYGVYDARTLPNGGLQVVLRDSEGFQVNTYSSRDDLLHATVEQSYSLHDSKLEQCLDVWIQDENLFYVANVDRQHFVAVYHGPGTVHLKKLEKITNFNAYPSQVIPHG